MLKNYKEAQKFINDLKRNIISEDKCKTDIDGHKIYFGGLNRIKELLRKINNPEDNLKIIHVVGTSGKGSVCSWLNYFLSNLGYKTGMFTSPSLITDIERISINDQFISPEEFVKNLNVLIPHIKQMKKHFKEGDPSPFEVVTVIAYMYLADQKVDYAIIEAGLGGKYDSTNATQKSIISVLTSVGEDHTDLLGDIHMIARDKASICEKSKKLITAVKEENILKDIKEICERYSSKLIEIKEEDSAALVEYKPNNIPEKIFLNYVLAIQVLKNIGITAKLSKDDFNNMKLPARFELFSENPKVILDGAHNMSKIKILFEYLKLNKLENIVCLFSVFEDKDFEEIIKFVSKKVSKIIFTQIDKRGRKSPGFDKLEKIALENLEDKNIYIEPNNLKAFVLARKIVEPNETIVVTGSFVHVAKIRELKWDEETILFKRKAI